MLRLISRLISLSAVAVVGFACTTTPASREIRLTESEIAAAIESLVQQTEKSGRLPSSVADEILDESYVEKDSYEIWRYDRPQGSPPCYVFSNPVPLKSFEHLDAPALDKMPGFRWHLRSVDRRDPEITFYVLLYPSSIPTHDQMQSGCGNMHIDNGAPAPYEQWLSAALRHDEIEEFQIDTTQYRPIQGDATETGAAELPASINCSVSRYVDDKGVVVGSTGYLSVSSKMWHAEPGSVTGRLMQMWRTACVLMTWGAPDSSQLRAAGVPMEDSDRVRRDFLQRIWTRQP